MADDQSSQTTVRTGNSTIGPTSSSLNDQYTLLNYDPITTGADEDDDEDDDEDGEHEEDEDSDDLSKSGNNGTAGSTTTTRSDNGNDITTNIGSLNIQDSNNNTQLKVQRQNGEEEGYDYDDDDDDDPLHVKELALSYDYLLFKIQDHTKQLSQRVELNVKHSKKQYESEIDKVNDHLNEIKMLITDCNAIEAEIDKLSQLNMISGEFLGRLEDVDKRLRDHTQKFKR